MNYSFGKKLLYINGILILAGQKGILTFVSSKKYPAGYQHKRTVHLTFININPMTRSFRSYLNMEKVLNTGSLKQAQRLSLVTKAMELAAQHKYFTFPITIPFCISM